MIVLPAIVGLVLLKWIEDTLSLNDFIAVAIVTVVFIIPIIFGMVFGGGDIRYGVFCALFVGLKPIGFFLIFAGVLHLVVLALLKKKSFGFAPAMSLAALGAYMVGNI